ncbi:hypothetical protein DSM106972_072080 [Dulcicalothrix desertica PCC 7102]|uniref:Uncharacterized protein n=1 Tax=Dulcicalothrix desertica PCC 7102 TaxID=232991 RepID=A0A3S1CDS2_9CYAN|nr:hypothetical protein DSM106972_072080 [Dulcicalothrix desertica PCC 7102]
MYNFIKHVCDDNSVSEIVDDNRTSSIVDADKIPCHGIPRERLNFSLRISTQLGIVDIIVF